MTNELQIHPQNRVTPILPNDFETAWRMSKAIAASGLAPKNITTPEAIFTAIQMGAEVGLSPMQALQNIAVINGRPQIWGSAQLGLVRSSGLLEIFEETIEGEGENMYATCTVKRKGEKQATEIFSVKDAKLAGLWGKAGPWVQYPKRMLKMRARGFALNDAFSDILKGLRSVEEMEGVQDVTPAMSVNDLNKEFLGIDTETGEITEVTIENIQYSDDTDIPLPPEAKNEEDTLAILLNQDESVWYPTNFTPKMLADRLMNTGFRQEFKANNSLVLPRVLTIARTKNEVLGNTIEKLLDS